MAYKRKYKPGSLITSLDVLYSQEFVYWRDKITHCGWVRSWQMRMAFEALQGKVIRYAIKITEEN